MDDEDRTRLRPQEERRPLGGPAKRARWLWYPGLVLAVGAGAAALWIRATAQEKDERGERRRREQEAIASAVEGKRERLEAAVKASKTKKSELRSAMGNAQNDADRSRFAYQLEDEVAREWAAKEQLSLIRSLSAAYAGSCVFGARRCVGDLDQVCGPAGQWEPGAACSKSGVCRNNECVSACSCAPGDPLCSCLERLE